MHYICIFLLLLIFQCKPAASCKPAKLNSTIHCDPGCYYDDITDPKCILCPAGYHCDDGSTKEPCVAGFYYDENDSGSKSFQQACKICKRGYYCPGPVNGDGGASPCPAGRWGTIQYGTNVTFACNNFCPLGKWGDVEGKTSQSLACNNKCAAGKYGVNVRDVKSTEQDACQDCEEGHYCTGDGENIPETPCSSGRYGNEIGKSTENEACPNLCKKGKYSSLSLTGKTKVDDACPNKCNVGKYGIADGKSTEDDACQDCESGHYCKGWDNELQSALETPCDMGTFGIESGKSTPEEACNQKCPNGRWGNVTGASVVENACKYFCPPGKYGKNGITNATSEINACEECEKGSYCYGTENTDNPQPQLCPGGKYGIADGKSAEDDACGKCPLGRYGNSSIEGKISVPVACPNTCPPGRFGGQSGKVIEDIACHICEGGNYCDGIVKKPSSPDVSWVKEQPCPGGRYGDVSVVGKSIMEEACQNECIKGKYGNLPGQVDEDKACPSYCEVTEYGTKQGGKDETNACAPCLPGRYCPGRTTLPILCEAGRYGNIGAKGTMEDACPDLCPLGKYSNPSLTGQTDELLACPHTCNITYIGILEGQTSKLKACGKCPPGNTCPGGYIKNGCRPGKYGNSAGQSDPAKACNMTCPAGRFGNETGKTTLNEACPGFCIVTEYGIKTAGTSEEEACRPCDSGYYCLGRINPKTPCPSGRFGNLKKKGNMEDACPTECPKGRYSDTTLKNQTTIEDACKYFCPIGSYGIKKGQTDKKEACALCPGGNYCPGFTKSPDDPIDSWVTKIECETGTWGNIENTSKQEDACPNQCPVGSFGKKTGSTTEIEACNSTCPAGKYATAHKGSHGKEEACRDCGSGYWCTGTTVVNGVEDDHRHPCIPGRYGDPNIINATTEEEGCTKSCPLGRYGNSSLKGFDNVEDACPFFCPIQTYGIKIGTIKKNEACRTCDPGYWCSGKTDKRSPCKGGTFGDISGQSNETKACSGKCIPGRFGNILGMTNLTSACPNDCPAGRFGSTVKGAKSPLECPTCNPGYFCLGGAKSTPCPRGKWGNRTEAQKEIDGCNKKCSVGKYGSAEGKTTDNLACTNCTRGKYGTEKGETSEEMACVGCEQGYYCPGGAEKNDCPAGTWGAISFQWNLTSACPSSCPPGKYSDISLTAKTTQKEACPYKCPAGKFGNHSGQVDEESECNNDCPPGRYGTELGKINMEEACELCEDGYYCTGYDAEGHRDGTIKGRHKCPAGRYSGYPKLITRDSIMHGCFYLCPNGTYGKEHDTGKTNLADACSHCEFGHFCFNAKRHDCPMGRYGKVDRAGNQHDGCPHKCSLGRYGTNTAKTSNQNACTQTCAAGSYGIKQGATNVDEACDACQPGKWCTGHVSDTGLVDPPSDCNAGRWGNIPAAKTEQEGCPNPCPVGKFGQRTGSTNVRDACEHSCPSGTYGEVKGKTTDGDACTDCIPGSWCEGGGVENMHPCPAGKFGQQKRQVSKELACNNTCPVGRFGAVSGQSTEADACPRKCQPGWYGKEISARESLPTDHTISCLQCDAGYYCSDTMKDYVPPTRQKCPGGRYAIPEPITRATMEVSCPGLCPLGKFGTLEGSVMDFVACNQVCKNGTHGIEEGQTLELKACGNCKKGTYQDKEGQPTCEMCDDGQYQNKEKQISCKECTDASPKGVACNDNGICSKLTGVCICTPGTGWLDFPFDNACGNCDRQHWKGTLCNFCRDDIAVNEWHDPKRNNAKVCKSPCKNPDDEHFSQKTGNCEEKLFNKVIDAMKWVVSASGGLVLLYKMHLFYTLIKEGKLKPGYRKTCKGYLKGFIAVLAYGQSGIHMKYSRRSSSRARYSSMGDRTTRASSMFSTMFSFDAKSTRTSSMFSSSSLGSVLDELLLEDGNNDGETYNSDDDEADQYYRRKSSLIEMKSNTGKYSSSDDDDDEEEEESEVFLDENLKNILIELNYEKYENNFIEVGCNNLEQVKYLDEEDLIEDIGMKKMHAKRFIEYVLDVVI